MFHHWWEVIEVEGGSDGVDGRVEGRMFHQVGGGGSEGEKSGSCMVDGDVEDKMIYKGRGQLGW